MADSVWCLIRSRAMITFATVFFGFDLLQKCQHFMLECDRAAKGYADKSVGDLFALVSPSLPRLG